MLDLKEIDAEIEKLENCNLTYSVCQKLANMYIIKDHWEAREPVRPSETRVSGSAAEGILLDPM